MIAIILWELRRRRGYLLWWCLGTTALIALLMGVYPSLHQQAQQLNDIFKQLPASVRALRGGSTDITSPIGYLNAELYYITLPLLLIIMTIGLGGSLLAKEEQDHTIELLLARPISRARLLAGKAISGILLVTIVGVISTLATIVLARVVDLEISTAKLVLTSAYTLAFSLSFGAVAFALSAASVVGRRAGVSVAVALSFGGYILTSLSSISNWIDTPSKLLPYHYFKPDQLLSGNLSYGLNVYLIAIFVFCVTLSWLGFRRRDIS